jgi:hypothetical protein
LLSARILVASARVLLDEEVLNESFGAVHCELLLEVGVALLGNIEL